MRDRYFMFVPYRTYVYYQKSERFSTEWHKYRKLLHLWLLCFGNFFWYFPGKIWPVLYSCPYRILYSFQIFTDGNRNFHSVSDVESDLDRNNGKWMAPSISIFYDAAGISSFSLFFIRCSCGKKSVWNFELSSNSWIPCIWADDGYQKCDHAAQLL